MKLLKKKITLLLMLVFTFCFTLNVGAAGEKYTLTLTNTSDAHTYQVYQILKSQTVVTDEGVQHLDSQTLDWGKDVDSEKMKAAFSVNSAVALSEKLRSDDSETGHLSTEVFISTLLNSEKSILKAGQEKAVDTGANEITFSFDEPCYILIRDKADTLSGADASYTQVMLRVVNSTDGTATVNAKSNVPTLIKKVKENSRPDVKFESSLPSSMLEGFNDVAAYAYGETIEFELIGSLPGDYKEYSQYFYQFNDTMSQGLTFVDWDPSHIFNVLLVHSDGGTEDITDKFTSSGVNNNSFTVYCNNLKDINNIDAASRIVLRYKAKLNSSAAFGLPGNENRGSLTFSNNPNTNGAGSRGKTPDDYVVVFTYQLDLTKQNAQSPHANLKDAEFVLYKKVDTQNYYYKTTGDTNVAEWVTNEAEATKMKSDENGKFGFAGLDSGVHYFLKEMVAPNGYHALATDLEFTIRTNISGSENNYSAGNAANILTMISITPAQDQLMVNPGFAIGSNGAGWQGTVSDGKVSAIVYNTNAAQLPVTGGIGTTIFYVVGTILVLIAGVLLITKKRMNMKQ